MISLLCDSHGIGYRAHHSTGSLDSGIAFGFLTTILQLAERYRTNQLIFCWDGPGSLRKKLFPAYKMARDTKTPEEKADRVKIHTQFDSLRKEILPALGFANHHQQSGYEADDLIASIIIGNPTRQFVVVSSDHDLFQLLQYHNCKGQHLLSSGKLMTASAFMTEYRIPARDWATVKAIAGCAGDGVTGVTGVGETTAIKFLLNEMPTTSKKWLFISESANMRLIHNNYKLVRLPFPGVKKTEIKEDSFDEETMGQVFSDLGMDSFWSATQAARWQRFCQRDFER